MKNGEVTYNVPLFFEQRIIKTLGMKFILLLFLLHKPLNLRKEKWHDAHIKSLSYGKFELFREVGVIEGLS